MAAGVAISMAMEASEKGLVSSEQTNGLDLRFGNGAALIALTQAIGEAGKCCVSVGAVPGAPEAD